MQLFRQMPQFRTQDIGKALSDRVFTILPNIAQDIGKALTLLSAQQEESKKREEKPENLL